MDKANLVADKLHSAGFGTKVVCSNAVAVSLTSRKVGVTKVEAAFDKIFERRDFEINQTVKGVLITWGN
jgi:hypothetical protein